MGTQTTQLIKLAEEVIFLADWCDILPCRLHNTQPLCNQGGEKGWVFCFPKKFGVKKSSLSPFAVAWTLAMIRKLFSGCNIKPKGLRRYVKMVTTCTENAKTGCDGVTAWELWSHPKHHVTTWELPTTTAVIDSVALGPQRAGWPRRNPMGENCISKKKTRLCLCPANPVLYFSLLGKRASQGLSDTCRKRPNYTPANKQNFIFL